MPEAARMIREDGDGGRGKQMEGNLRRRNGEGALKGRCVEDRDGAAEILHCKINVKPAVSGYVQAERKTEIHA